MNIDMEQTSKSTDVKIPNFFYIGTSKAGSTWIYNLLLQHPQVYMAPGKGLYFFDSNYNLGFEWYLDHFKPSDDKLIIGEVSHTYLYSILACQRIYRLNPNAKLMVCLREPVERAFSDYLHAVKNTQFHGTFEEALEKIPSLIEKGRYVIHLAPYIERFGRKNIYVALFDDLTRDPREFAKNLFSFLGLESIKISESVSQKMMPAGKPRSRVLAQLAKKGSSVLRRLRWRKLRGKIKTSRFIRNLFFGQFELDDKPKINSATGLELKKHFRNDVIYLEKLLGIAFSELWRYSRSSDSEMISSNELLQEGTH